MNKYNNKCICVDVHLSDPAYSVRRKLCLREQNTYVEICSCCGNNIWMCKSGKCYCRSVNCPRK